MIFLLGTTTELTDPAGAAKAVAQGRPAVVEGRQEKAFQVALAALGQTARPAGVVEGFDYSDGDKERLTLYHDPCGRSSPHGCPMRTSSADGELGHSGLCC